MPRTVAHVTRRLSLAVAALTASLALPVPARAWDDTGHMTVALLAWRQMTPAARRQAVALLRAAPLDAGLRNVGTRLGRTADADEALFVGAAVWADLVRDPWHPGTRYHRSSWHFVDHYWRRGAAGPELDPTRRPRPENVAERLGLLAPTLGGAVPAGGAAASLPPGVRLAWVLHLAGDIHQPLHASSLVTPRHPDGDRGGNLDTLDARDRNPAFRELHAYWDRILDTAIPRRPAEPTLAHVARVADRVGRDHPPAALAARLAPGAYGQWAREGLATAQRQVYAGMQEGRRPDAAYQAAAFRAAAPAVALAGYRLADLLNRALR
jgi:hypothetical protein